MTTTPKPHIGQELLSRAHAPDTAEQLFTERIKHKPLYLRPTSPTPADNRNRRRLHRLRKKEYFLRKQKPKPLSARQKRASGLYDLPKEECKYAVFKELHKLWVEYMHDILDVKDRPGQFAVTPLSHGSKLVSADFHGAEVEVVRSRCAGRVSTKGIVVRDTMFTFVVVTEKDEVKTVPKEHTVFRFSVPLPEPQNDTTEGSGDTSAGKNLVFELHGSQFENRPVDRANKKFKWRNVDYL
ncbi:RNase P/RNase MRP complex subunit [Aspergillus candidus]|uniref:Ribonuclease P protein subunit n=1 Tax=Aspergillus candidus TaxID=41067 RepID=A0A2I2FNH1_ASPCN|nr:RNase P/MRP, p29 subunit [Aspergillus candidus]PLB42158.1 RNase P/MRP, p29 subunit [Aspergillus candidus]